MMKQFFRVLVLMLCSAMYPAIGAGAAGADSLSDDELAKYGSIYQNPGVIALKTKLTPMQFEVTQEDATERAYTSGYWDNKAAGIYVDVVSGEPLFSSADKYDSKTGWPSFTRPIHAQLVIKKTDFKLIWPRTEVRSRFGDSHLGHLFKDGPKPTGLRYCVNSAALRFVAKADLEAEGYGKYLSLF